MDADFPAVFFIDGFDWFVWLGGTPIFDGGVQTWFECGVEFTLGDGAFHGRPRGSGAEPYDPAPVRGY